MTKIPIYKPFIPVKSEEYAIDAIKSSWISSIGPYLEKVEDKLRKLTGCKYVVLVNNGTSATHLVAKCLYKFNPSIKRVLIPSACYVAAYNCLLYDKNKWNIKCLDLDASTWNMKIEKIEEGDAIFAVHNLGNIINIPVLKEKFNCPIVEDNCEGLFGFYNQLPAGSASLCSSLSFFGNKNITCGEGGAFLTNDEKVYKFATKVKSQGQTSTRYVHDELGYNYRMTNIQAALLLGQLEESELIKKNKERIFNYYMKTLGSIEGVSTQEIEEGTSHSMWMIGARFHPENFCLSKLESEFTENGIETRRMFYPYTAHNHLNFKGESKLASSINSQVLILPSYPELKNLEIDRICYIIAQHKK
tara:strand:- start:4095 stop:5174 length:1080 start_codon:yes stop_codon:yes gene_type:complete